MDLVDYVSFDEVRAALGVEEDELTDSTLSLDLYKFNLISELNRIDPTLMTVYAAQQLIDAPTDLTAAQTTFMQSVLLFSAYAVAKQLTVTLPMFAPKDVTDGKAATSRFTLDPYKATIASVLAMYDTFKIQLIDAFAGLTSVGNPIATTRPYFVVASPNYDPVIGDT